MIRSLANRPVIDPLPCAYSTAVVDLAAHTDLSDDVIRVLAFIEYGFGR